MLGAFRLWVDGVAVDAQQWRLRKARTVVKLLGLAPNHQLHREQILAHLWPDLEPTAAANNLHQALHVARRQLAGPGTAHPFLTIKDEHVQLCPDAALWVDVDAFETAASQARTAHDPAAYRDALALYAGELLPDDRYDEWSLTRRAWLAGLNTKLKLELAGLLAERAAVAEALDVLDSLLFQDPAHEQTCLLYMRLCARLGQRQRAMRCYSDLRTALARDLDLAPGEACAQAYREVLAAPPLAAELEPADDGPASRARPGHCLPVPATAFVGRNAELETLRHWLSRRPGTSASGNPINRLVTLTGVGGVGKTRLAIQAVAGLEANFRDGIWFIDLAPLTDPDLIEPTLATGLGLVPRQGQSPGAQARAYLRERRALLIVDNCEHLRESAAAVVTDLLAACPNLTVLATSRAPLGIPGERVFAVAPLARPGAGPWTAAGVEAFDAIQLFVRRGQTVQPGFALTDSNAAAIGQICQCLDGLPLALELAAAHLSVLSASQIADLLTDRFRLLTHGPDRALPRQRTLHASIAWSYDLLDERERGLMRRLSVFAGGWSLESAHAVAAEPDADPYTTLDGLTRLQRQSLIVVEPGSEYRYTFLETIRQFGLEQLRAADEDDRTRVRQLRYFLGLTQRAEPHLRAEGMVAWLDRIEAEHDNLRAALTTALAVDIPAALHLLVSLEWYWHIRAHQGEAIAWLQQALECERVAHTAATRTASQCVSRGKALTVLANLGLNAIEPRAAIAEWLREARACLAETPGAELGFALTRSAQMTGDAAASERYLTLAEEQFNETKSLFGQAECSMIRMQAAALRGDREEATRLAYALQLRSHQIGDLDGWANAQGMLAHMALEAQQYERASALYAECLRINQEVGNRVLVSFVQQFIGHVPFYQGDLVKAEAVWSESLQHGRESGDRLLMALGGFGLAGCAWARGDGPRAIQGYQQSGALFEEVGYWPEAASCCHAQGDVSLSQGEATLAGLMYEAELRMGRERECPECEGYALSGLGRVAAVQGQADRSFHLHTEALAIGRDMGSHPVSALAQLGLGRELLRRRDFEAAHGCLCEALHHQQRFSPWPYGVELRFVAAVAHTLDAFATLAVARGKRATGKANQLRLRRAVRLFSAATTAHDFRFSLSPLERADRLAALEAARQGLRQEEFQPEWTAGGQLNLEAASALAEPMGSL